MNEKIKVDKQSKNDIAWMIVDITLIMLMVSILIWW